MNTSHVPARLDSGVLGAGRFTFSNKNVGTRALSALPTTDEIEAEAVAAVKELYAVVAAVEFEPTPDDLGAGGSFTHLKSVQFVDGQTLNREDTGAVTGGRAQHHAARSEGGSAKTGGRWPSLAR